MKVEKTYRCKKTSKKQQKYLTKTIEKCFFTHKKFFLNLSRNSPELVRDVGMISGQKKDIPGMSCAGWGIKLCSMEWTNENMN